MIKKSFFLLAIALAMAMRMWVLEVQAGSPSNFISLKECEKISLEKHPAVHLVQEEVELSNRKRQEALRTIWPNLTLKAEQTLGKAEPKLGTPDFTEQSYGMQFSQVVFQGGKLYQTFRQAHFNCESIKAKQLKVRQETLFNLRESYWNLIKAIRSLEIYRSARTYLENEKKMAEHLLKNDVISQQVYLTINAQYEQSAFQIESAQAEVESRLWQWTAALGLKSPPESRPRPTILEEMNSSNLTALLETINLGESLSSTEKNHPDILVQKNAMESALFGSKVSKSYLWPQVDINAGYGRSGGAFKGESLTLKEDWQLGARLSMNFAANSLNFSGLKQKTSPKLGQSSRTELETVSGSLGLLDGLKNRSERKEGDLVYKQAQVQLEKTQMEVLNNVRESYAQWKKAISQLKISENELALAKTDFAVAEIRSSHREVPISERSVSRNKLAQAEVGLAEAQSSYAISLASFNRAIGTENRFSLENP